MFTQAARLSLTTVSAIFEASLRLDAVTNTRRTLLRDFRIRWPTIQEILRFSQRLPSHYMS